VGCLGELAPAVTKAAGIKGRGQYLEIALGPVIARLAGRVPQFAEPPKFPAVKRDLALVVRQDAACAELEAVIREAGGAELEAVRLFDRYQGAQVGPGRTSMAFALSLRAAGRTMTDAEADAACARIVAALRQRTGAEVRTS
ncbi:MAG: phenylalanine--tRNA ligase subunit beta, partial [Candidatus Edwardsbacteria bacterium]|nr:phenylalanine--tRNA ligase subunit beta [Candidatus Edwardsbacteria bacterium]